MHALTENLHFSNYHCPSIIKKLARPYEEAFKQIETAFRNQEEASLKSRGIKVLTGLSLLVPIVNRIEYLFIRSFFPQNLIFSKQQLEKGIEITEDMKNEIKGVLDDRNSWSNELDLSEKHYQIISRDGNLIFKLNKYPNLIFKLCDDEYPFPTEDSKRIEENEKKIINRFHNMMRMDDLRDTNNLDALVIPRAKIAPIELSGRVKHVIVEELLDLANSSESKDYHTYLESGDRSTRALKQLTTLATHGLSGLELRNIPPLRSKYDFKIGLVDLEKVYFFGHGVREILNSVSSVKQANQIVSHAIWNSAFQMLAYLFKDFDDRLKTLSIYHETITKAKAHYEAKGIVTNTPISYVSEDDVKQSELSADIINEEIKKLNKTIKKQSKYKIGIYHARFVFTRDIFFDQKVLTWLEENNYIVSKKAMYSPSYREVGILC